jgi:hypothetical protein
LNSLLTDLSLDADGPVELIRRMLRGDRTRRIEDYSLSVWTRMTSQSGTGTIVDRVADIVGADLQSPDAAGNVIQAVLEEVGRELAASQSRAASRCELLLRAALDSRGRLAAAEVVMKTLSQALMSAREIIDSQSRELQQAFSETCAQAGGFQGPVAAENPALKPFCRQYCMLFLLQSAGELVATQRRALQASIVRVGEEKIEPLRKRLTALQGLVRGSEPATEPIPWMLVQSFEDYLLTAGRFRLSRLQHADPGTSEASALKTDAANFLLASVGAGVQPSRIESEGDGASSITAGARPRLNNVGGGQRVVAVTPEGVPPEVWHAQLTGEFGDCVSVTSMPRQDICVCCETEGIAITAAIDSLSHLKPKVMELASRLHSRNDIPW